MKDKILEYAYFLLSKKDYTEQELLNKFKSRFPEGTGFFEQVLDKLKEYNYINDEKYFQNYVKSKSLSSYGPYYIKMKLQNKGIYKSIEEISDLINKNFDQKEQIRQLLSKKKYSSKKYNKYQLKKKYFDFLIRRGFDMNIINQVLQEDLIDESYFS
jgi:regulatory protein